MKAVPTRNDDNPFRNFEGCLEQFVVARVVRGPEAASVEFHSRRGLRLAAFQSAAEIGDVVDAAFRTELAHCRTRSRSRAEAALRVASPKAFPPEKPDLGIERVAD